MNIVDAILAAADARKDGLQGKYPLAAQVLAEEVFHLRGRCEMSNANEYPVQTIEESRDSWKSIAEEAIESLRHIGADNAWNKFGDCRRFGEIPIKPLTPSDIDKLCKIAKQIKK